MWRDRLFPLIMSSPQILSSIQGSDFVPWCWWRANMKRLFQKSWNDPKSLLLANMTIMILKTKTSGFDATFPPVRILFQPSWRWFGNMVPYFRKASKHSKAFYLTSYSNYNLFTQNNFSPRVFVNSIFEIEKNHSLPETKTELLE